MTSLTPVPEEVHPLPPFLPAGMRLLMLGAFPPPRARWSMEFFYPNFINDMWRIFGHVFFADKAHFVAEGARTFRLDELRRFLTEKRIGCYDTALRVRRLRGNASDKFLEVAEPADIPALLRAFPTCEALLTTGQKATDTLRTLFDVPEPAVGEGSTFAFEGRTLTLYRLLSSSRAYPMKLERKAEAYARVFSVLGML